MTATANDIIVRALRRINVLAAQEAPDAAESQDSLTILNDMLFAFSAMGIQYVHSALTPTTVLNFPDEQIRNVMLALAGELADEFGMPIGPSLGQKIEDAKLELQAAYLSSDPAVPDRAIRTRRPGFYDFNRGS